MRLIFHLDCEERIFNWISRNTYPNWMGLVSLWSRNENLSYELKLIVSSFVAISTTVHGFEVVQPMFIKFNNSSKHESHQDVIPSSYLTHFHTQDFRKISQLVIFKLSSCDSSPHLEPIIGESSNMHKMSYTHPNLIMLVSMGSRRREEEMRKYPFWYFSDDQLWPLNFQPNISKMEYLDFYSFVCKTEDSSGKLVIGRRHGQKPILRF